MKVKLLDAHDRFEHFTNKDFDIGKKCQETVDARPFGNHPFYIYMHARTIDEDERRKLYWMDYFSSLSDPGRVREYEHPSDVPNKRLIRQPRLTKPLAQTNSALFKGYPGTDIIKIIWIIPPREIWAQFDKGKMTHNATIAQSIYDFVHNRQELERSEEDDLPDSEIAKIYEEISKQAKSKPKA